MIAGGALAEAFTTKQQPNANAKTTEQTNADAAGRRRAREVLPSSSNLKIKKPRTITQRLWE
jgi:hypothetical protein